MKLVSFSHTLTFKKQYFDNLSDLALKHNSFIFSFTDIYDLLKKNNLQKRFTLTVIIICNFLLESFGIGSYSSFLMLSGCST